MQRKKEQASRCQEECPLQVQQSKNGKLVPFSTAWRWAHLTLVVIAGEANANYNNALYNCTFPEKINDWREKWRGGFGPYGFVQLANFVGNGGVTVRWHQTADYGYTPNPSMENVFMAVAIDTYDEPSGIHPRLVVDVYNSPKMRLD